MVTSTSGNLRKRKPYRTWLQGVAQWTSAYKIPARKFNKWRTSMGGKEAASVYVREELGEDWRICLEKGSEPQWSCKPYEHGTVVDRSVFGPHGVGSSDVSVGEGEPAALVGLCESFDAFSILKMTVRILSTQREGRVARPKGRICVSLSLEANHPMLCSGAFDSSDRSVDRSDRLTGTWLERAVWCVTAWRLKGLRLGWPFEIARTLVM